jgi:hypothetical protein
MAPPIGLRHRYGEMSIVADSNTAPAADLPTFCWKKKEKSSFFF